MGMFRRIGQLARSPLRVDRRSWLGVDAATAGGAHEPPNRSLEGASTLITRARRRTVVPTSRPAATDSTIKDSMANGALKLS